jgi:hypothetical protein
VIKEIKQKRLETTGLRALNQPDCVFNVIFHDGALPSNNENYQALSSPLMGEDSGGGGHDIFPLTPPSPTRGEGVI